MTEQNSEIRADPTFKLITNRLAQEIGLKVIGAELPQTLTADLALEIPPELGARLKNSLFNFLEGYQYAIVEFKGQNDQFTLPKFLANLARTALFCLKHEEVAVKKVLNLYVCSQYPDGILGLANTPGEKGLFTNPPGRNWLWHASFFFQEIMIVVCRDLPVEPIYYDWLVFAPADSKKWREFVKTAIREGRRDIIEILIRLRPKELRAMTINVDEILEQLDPHEREQLEAYYAELIAAWLPMFTAKNPDELVKILADSAVKLPPAQLKKFIQLLTAQAEKKQDTNGDHQ
jgi:hypothetical protein